MVLAQITKELDLSLVEVGLVGASTLIGIFFGSPIVGYLTDRFGRRRLFTIDIVAFIILGALQLFVTTGWQLVLVRLLLGVAIGAEYAIGSAMLAELSPSHGRGGRLSWLVTMWYVRFLVSVVAAYVLTDANVPWRWILASSALPAIVTFVLRYGLPESPRWLMSRDRVEEARQIVNKYLGGESYFTTEQLAGESVRPAEMRELLAPGMRTRTAFCCIFWFALLAPYFAIFTFAPLVFSTLNISDERVSTIAANGVAALGAVAGTLVIERTGRRPLLIWSFWVTTVTLAVIVAGRPHPGSSWSSVSRSSRSSTRSPAISPVCTRASCSRRSCGRAGSAWPPRSAVSAPRAAPSCCRSASPVSASGRACSWARRSARSDWPRPTPGHPRPPASRSPGRARSRGSRHRPSPQGRYRLPCDARPGRGPSSMLAIPVHPGGPVDSRGHPCPEIADSGLRAGGRPSR
ncbi:MFS transporter [Pseudonocardia sp. RS11V-5]|nr:MFS transporter [Pseudonocardia terrae]MCE3551299.1 MFS transporter [Pseudonocardia terrae]